MMLRLLADGCFECAAATCPAGQLLVPLGEATREPGCDKTSLDMGVRAGLGNLSNSWSAG